MTSGEASQPDGGWESGAASHRVTGCRTDRNREASGRGQLGGGGGRRQAALAADRRGDGTMAPAETAVGGAAWATAGDGHVRAGPSVGCGNREWRVSWAEGAWRLAAGGGFRLFSPPTLTGDGVRPPTPPRWRREVSARRQGRRGRLAARRWRRPAVRQPRWTAWRRRPAGMVAGTVLAAGGWGSTSGKATFRLSPRDHRQRCPNHPPTEPPRRLVSKLRRRLQRWPRPVDSGGGATVDAAPRSVACDAGEAATDGGRNTAGRPRRDGGERACVFRWRGGGGWRR